VSPPASFSSRSQRTLIALLECILAAPLVTHQRMKTVASLYCVERVRMECDSRQMRWAAVRPLCLLCICSNTRMNHYGIGTHLHNHSLLIPECTVGYFLNATTKLCTQCTEGSICVGGLAQPEDCGLGMTTLIRGARTKEQCGASTVKAAVLWQYFGHQTSPSGQGQSD
jgi:hypothetical protein